MSDTSRARPPVRQLPAPGYRSDALDFWRGVILCTIFINHIPGNVFEKVTFRNVGFSDSAEAFVFISGMALALAYGRRFDGGQPRPAILSLMRRATKLYAVHILMSLAGLAVFAAGAAYFKDDGLMLAHGRELAMDAPRAALLGLATLGHQFGYFNILPLYVVLVGFAPVLFWLARFGRPVMLGASAALYGVTRLSGLNLPTWPIAGGWFLDPFAWQLMLAIGIACGLRLAAHRSAPAPPPNRALLVVAGAVVAVSAFCATDGFGLRPGLFDALRATGDLDKTMMGLGRLVHFLCLAYLVAGLGLASAMREAPWFGPLRLIGRHGLVSFVLLSLLAALGQVLEHGLGHTLGLDMLIVGGGLGLIYAGALLLQHRAAVARPAATFVQLRSAGPTTL